MKSATWTGAVVRLWLGLGLMVVGPRVVLGQTVYPRAGWETHLSQTGHGVKGTATIIDQRTIRLTHFSYDGYAPDMYVYLATNLSNAAFLNSGWTVSPRLARAYVDETLDVTVPQGQTLDGWTSISIWCRAVQASFGWGSFAPAIHPRLTVSRQTNAVEVRLSGEIGQKYWLESTTNAMDSNSWTSLVLLTNLTGTVRYTNSLTTNWPGRFYRALRD